jgi:oligopeptide transport system ATP-binding protein
VHASHGSVEWLGKDLLNMSAAALRVQRRDLQIVFQDPLASLNPRMSVGDTVAEPLKIFEPGLSTRDRRLRIAEMFERVGLNAGIAARYPHEFSGGQCQRIGIARAMVLRPKLLICDEPVSSLDVSIQGQIVNLLLDLQRDAGTAMLFISHNLALVRHLSHRVLVMYLGRIVEVAERDSLFAAPIHPYTRALMSALPGADAGGDGVPAARLLAAGCAYRDRCPLALPVCETTLPPLEEVVPGHRVACHRSHEAPIPLSLRP